MNLDEFINSSNKSKGSYAKPFIIAEAGVNHEAKMDLALRLIDEAKEGGADAIKFQSYKADTIASKNSPSYWNLANEPTTSQYHLFKKYDAFWKKEFEALKLHCDSVDIEFLSTPFDIESSDFLNDLMGTFKISSSDLNNKPFIKYISSFNKPIVLSTGASYLNEIDRTIEWIKEKGNPLALLHCILNYPTENKNANLSMIVNLKDRYPDLLIGYSDHTLPQGMKNIETSVLLGAKIIEKHFTFDKTLPGNDHYHAMDKQDLKILNDRLNNLGEVLGSYDKEPIESEMISRENARRSLVLVDTLNKGDILSNNNITFKRPGSGIDPSDIDKIIGKCINKDLEADHILTWEDIGS